mmetsp:Transcript_1307/g.2805  ORF Transcript_1307/g.2805 Transcript_1307/m.2805 type:complete len:168 (-) Transcript_1307:21-524(-)
MASFAFGGGDAGDQQGVIEESTPWVAAGDGDLALLRKAMQKLGLAPSAADNNGFTFVHAAAAYCRVDVLRWLLRQDGVDVNAADADGDTPLHHCDEKEVARILIEEGKADWSVRNAEGKTVRQAKEEELREGEQGAEDDSDDEDVAKLRELVTYLKSLEGGKDEDMQ